MIRVFLVDDHPIVREGVAAVLESERDIDVVGSADSAETLLADLERARPDVVLLDLALPGIGGVEVTARLSRTAPSVRVVVFSAHEDDGAVLAAVRAGARGYVVKGAAGAEIIRAIRAVSAGESYLHGAAAGVIAAEVRRPGDTGGLSPREREVLRLVGEGQSNKQIAVALGITERTAKFHVRQIMTKLGAENRAQAVALAARRSLL
jgi:DNA-binding NarL/FixJ family response regulator